MLECGTNFKGKLPEYCTLCNCRDDENHRLNECPKFADINLLNSAEKVYFPAVYSEDIDALQKIIPYFTRICDTKNAHGTVHKWSLK